MFCINFVDCFMETNSVQKSHQITRKKKLCSFTITYRTNKNQGKKVTQFHKKMANSKSILQRYVIHGKKQNCSSEQQQLFRNNAICGIFKLNHFPKYIFFFSIINQISCSNSFQLTSGYQRLITTQRMHKLINPFTTVSKYPSPKVTQFPIRTASSHLILGSNKIDDSSDINTNSQIDFSMENEQQRQEKEQEEENEVITYFSPNVELKKNKYQYSDDNCDENRQQQEEIFGISEKASSSINEYSFFDEAIIYVRAGSGGQGASTYKKGVNKQDAQPDGGDGGKGGDIIVVCDHSLNTLAGLTNAWRPNSFGGGGAAASLSNTNQYLTRPMSFRAENGSDGARMFKNGRYAKDVIIRVPPGTVIQEEIDEYDIDPKTGEKVLLRTNLIDVGTVDANSSNNIDEIEGEEYFSESIGQQHPSSLIVAKGGMGGEGSGVVGKGGRGVRRTRSSPIGGERKRLKLTLKIVADVALVGVPNAGKSTFLASVTRAKPKIANYPFTTVIPNLGVWIPPLEQSYSNVQRTRTGAGGSAGLVLCDVPGLIAGAAEGVGLGHAFLRHVERCHVILHLVDATSINPIEDFKMLNREILRYGNGKLAQMPQIVVVNKIDAWEDQSENKEDWEKGLKTRLTKEQLENELRSVMTHSRLMFMSAKGKDGVDDLMIRMHSFVKKVKDSVS